MILKCKICNKEYVGSYAKQSMRQHLRLSHLKNPVNVCDNEDVDIVDGDIGEYKSLNRKKYFEQYYSNNKEKYVKNSMKKVSPNSTEQTQESFPNNKINNVELIKDVLKYNNISKSKRQALITAQQRGYVAIDLETEELEK